MGPVRVATRFLCFNWCGLDINTHVTPARIILSLLGNGPGGDNDGGCDD